jgi:(+)-trans-carveol dehydrogenase
MGRLEGKVALVTGGAQGQGRSHAVELAREGADVVVLDVCQQLPGVPYRMGTEEKLLETARSVEALGRRAVAVKADVRDLDALQAAIGDGVDRLNGLDIVAANAGIVSKARRADVLDRETWQQMIDVNLTGVWQT